jgi:O-methyltransferase involved in polyketide biosynthesis
MSDFADKLNALVSLELANGTINNPEAMSGVIESIASSLAFSAALAAKGDANRISMILEGLTGYIFETAADRAPLARMITSAMDKDGTK